MDTLEKNYIPRAKRGPMRRQADRSLLRINNWPAAVAVLGLIFGAILLFSDIRSTVSKTEDKVEEARKRIEKLENQSGLNVSLREYQESQKRIDDKLASIDKKLDAVAEYNRRH